MDRRNYMANFPQPKCPWHIHPFCRGSKCKYCEKEVGCILKADAKHMSVWQMSQELSLAGWDDDYLDGLDEEEIVELYKKEIFNF